MQKYYNNLMWWLLEYYLYENRFGMKCQKLTVMILIFKWYSKNHINLIMILYHNTPYVQKAIDT